MKSILLARTLSPLVPSISGFEYLISGTKSYRDFGQTGPAGPGPLSKTARRNLLEK